MQKFTLLLAALFIFGACNNTNKSSKSKVVDAISVQVKLTDTAAASVDTLRIFAWNAIQVEEVAKQTLTNTEGVYSCTFNLGKLHKGMYYMGESLKDLKPFLLGTEAIVSLEGESNDMVGLKVIDSDLNKEYERLLESSLARNQHFLALLTEYNQMQSQGKTEALADLKERMAKEDKEKKRLLDSFANKNSELTRIMAFNAFQSFQNNGTEGQVEGDYFAQSFLQFVDTKDTVYSRLPFYYENIKNYASALTQVGLKPEQQQAALDTLLASVPESNPNFKPTLVGCMLGMMGRNNALFVRYAEIYNKKFKGDYAMLDKFVNEQLIQLRGAASEGMEAPDLVGPNPTGVEKSLSQMRGKVVLVDFWASWCGPCRRENPNVVRLYDKYKDKGFDILGVSLDNNKDRWIDAIAKDKLTWTHISDLKGWSSGHAKLYGVRGIPYTVLVDKEGKILAKNLRGHNLEAKLKELFGE